MMYLGIVGVLSVSLGEVFGDTLIECRKNVSFCTWEYHCSNILWEPLSMLFLTEIPFVSI